VDQPLFSSKSTSGRQTAAGRIDLALDQVELEARLSLAEFTTPGRASAALTGDSASDNLPRSSSDRGPSERDWLQTLADEWLGRWSA
jgi:hypothetical protein